MDLETLMPSGSRPPDIQTHHSHTPDNADIPDEQDAERAGCSALISDIEHTLTHTESWIQAILDDTGWTEEHILEQEEHGTCPFDKNHIVPRSKMESHIKYCPLVSQGYTKEELDAEWSESHKFYYEKSNTVITMDLDAEKQRSILYGQEGYSSQGKPLPITMEKAMSDLSTNQKLRLHQFCVQSAQAARKTTAIRVEDLQLLEAKKDDNQPKSRAEQMLAERDLKRRRQSYRKKGVHTANKSYSEVIREVINQQTDILTDIWHSESRDRRRDRKARDTGSSRHGSRHRTNSDTESHHSYRHKPYTDNESHHGNHKEASEKRRDEADRKKSKRDRSHSPQSSDNERHASKKHKKKQKKKHKKHKSKSDSD